MQRLSIAYLLVATAAVAIGITVARAINDLYFLSDARFFGTQTPADMDLMAIALLLDVVRRRPIDWWTITKSA